MGSTHLEQTLADLFDQDNADNTELPDILIRAIFDRSDECYIKNYECGCITIVQEKELDDNGFVVRFVDEYEIFDCDLPKS